VVQKRVNRSPSEILERATTIAVVGASRDPRKPGGSVPYGLQQRGFRIIPINPYADELFGERVYRSLSEVKEKIDLVDVFRPAADAPAIAREAAAIGAGALWLQLDIRSTEARRIAAAAGMDYVEDQCTAEVDAGRFPSKRSIGEVVVVEADVFADGHDSLASVLRYRHHASEQWTEAPMTPLVNDRWRGSFAVTQLGRYAYTVEGWIDPFRTWSKQLAKRIDAGQDVKPDLEIGARLVEAAAARASGDAGAKLTALAQALRKLGPAMPAAQGDQLQTLMDRHADRSQASRYARELEILVD